MKFTRWPRIALAAAAIGALASTGALADISGSKHDLTSAGTGQGGTTATTEVCVFCHTPHGSNTNASAPLWNKTLPDGGSYTRYSNLGTATLDGDETATVGSVSLACLSCHDGSQAMDVVWNAPGSGGYDSSGTQQIDGTAIGAMTGTPIPMLGTDLQNDHPIGIEYAGGSCTGTSAACTPTAATGDADFRTAQHATINGGSVWWVDTSVGTANVREKTDMILYTQNFTGGSGPSVECGSCHDPHEASSTPVSFLRINNNNSNVCLACHIK
ncbi:MAG: cytochrome c3 family protein [Gammaproteobacteria bacterium]